MSERRWPLVDVKKVKHKKMGKTKTTTESKEEVKKEITPKEGEEKTVATSAKEAQSKTPKKKVTSGILYIDATFNNTKVLFGDKLGNTLFWSSAGTLGFRGAKKGTPFAASKVGDLIGDKAATLGVKDSGVVVRGVGSGREPAIRAFSSETNECRISA